MYEVLIILHKIRVEGGLGRSDLAPSSHFFLKINVIEDEWCNFFHHLSHFTTGAHWFLMRCKIPENREMREICAI